MTRVPAYQSPASVALTQHQMVNIGIGNEPDSPLKYAVLLNDPNIIMPLKTKVYATSHGEALCIVADVYPGFEIIESYLV